MSIFGSIMSRIFGHADAQPAAASGGAPAAGAPTTGTAAGSAPAAAQTPTSAGGAPSGSAVPQASTPAQPVDVESVLNERAAKAGQTLNWRSSIVDLMKLLGLDSSLENRKELAKELNYSGDTNDSATMNVWLHKEVMRKLAENGGNVPADLKG